MGRLSKRITQGLWQNGIISLEESPLYEYGLHEIGVTLLNLITDLLVGALMRMTVPCIIFLVIYIPLRRFAGGYHAKTELRCYGISTLLVLSALCVIRVIPANGTVLLSMLVGASIVIWLLAPIDSANKSLDKTEYRVYRRRSRGILIIHWVLTLAVALLSFWETISVLVIADVFLGIMLMFGLLKHR